MNEETREALDAQSVDMDRIKDDIRGLQEDARLALRKLNDMADNSSDSTISLLLLKGAEATYTQKRKQPPTLSRKRRRGESVMRNFSAAHVTNRIVATSAMNQFSPNLHGRPPRRRRRNIRIRLIVPRTSSTDQTVAQREASDIWKPR